MTKAIRKCAPYLVNVAIISFVPIFNLVTAFREGQTDLAAAWFMCTAAVWCMIALMILVQHLRNTLTDLAEALRTERYNNDRLTNAVQALRWQEKVTELERAEQQATWN